jgi:hypothetical protein
MRAGALILLLAGCAASPAPRVIPADLRVCDVGAPNPGPLPALITPEQLRAYASQTEAARALNEYLLRMCADKFDRLQRWIEDRNANP